MRIKEPNTSEIAYIENSFKLTDCEGNVIKEITLDELKNWQKYEEEIKLSDSEKQFIKSCLDNLYECKFNDITHIVKDKSSLVFCNYQDYKINYLENIHITGFNSLRENVVYSLKELDIV